MLRLLPDQVTNHQVTNATARGCVASRSTVARASALARAPAPAAAAVAPPEFSNPRSNRVQLRLRSLSSTIALTTAARPVAIGPWLGLHSPPYRPGLLFSGLLFSAIVTVNSEPSRTWLSLAVGTECMSGTPRYSLRVLVYTLSSRVGP